MKSRLLLFFSLFTTTLFCRLQTQAQSPILWGMTSEGGLQYQGNIFHFNTVGSETNNYDFGNASGGQAPYGSLMLANNGLLYGLTSAGGANGEGIIFSYNVSSDTEIDLYDFGAAIDGQHPYGSLIPVSDNILYGMTSSGGVNGKGIIFSYNISTGEETDVHDFGSGSDGKNPYGSLIVAYNGLLYGMTSLGGAIDSGAIFSFNDTTGKETVVHSFGGGTDGLYPHGSLLQANDSLLYGMTNQGGVNTYGIIFSYNISKGIETDIHDFSGFDGQYPGGSLIQASDSLLYGMTELGGLNDSGIIFNYNISNAAEIDVHDFADSDGQYPVGSLFRASNGLLYGMTTYGGAYGVGTILSYNILTGTETDIYDFSDTSGEYPWGNLIEDDVTGINQLSAANNQVSVYPNPTSGQFTVKLNNYQNGYSIEIYNVMGERIYQAANKSSLGDLGVINLAAQPTGIYFVYLKSGKGVDVQKIILSK